MLTDTTLAAGETPAGQPVAYTNNSLIPALGLSPLIVLIILGQTIVYPARMIFVVIIYG